MHAGHLGAVLRVVQDEVGGHDAGADDVLAVVHVMDEAVERRDPLHQPLLHAAPLVGGDDAGDQVERDQALVARATLILGAIDGKGDAHAPEDHLGLGPAGLHHVRGLLAQPMGVALVVLPHVAAVKRQHGVHLVKFLHERASCRQDSKL